MFGDLGSLRILSRGFVHREKVWPRTGAPFPSYYSHSPLPFLEACARRYGDPFTIRLAGYGKFVMLADPQAVKDVFRGDPHALHSGEGNEFLTAPVGRNSVLVKNKPRSHSGTGTL
jgi:cytochrome P450